MCEMTELISFVASQSSLRVTRRNSRLCDKEITIGGIKIPKGAHIDIPTYGLSRDAEYWDDPDEFVPER